MVAAVSRCPRRRFAAATADCGEDRGDGFASQCGDIDTNKAKGLAAPQQARLCRHLFVLCGREIGDLQLGCMEPACFGPERGAGDRLSPEDPQRSRTSTVKDLAGIGIAGIPREAQPGILAIDFG